MQHGEARESQGHFGIPAVDTLTVIVAGHIVSFLRKTDKTF